MVQLKMLTLDKAKLGVPVNGSLKFDPTNHIKLVHLFQEKEVDKYFDHFQKVVTNLKWQWSNGPPYCRVGSLGKLVTSIWPSHLTKLIMKV